MAVTAHLCRGGPWQRRISASHSQLNCRRSTVITGSATSDHEPVYIARATATAPPPGPPSPSEPVALPNPPPPFEVVQTSKLTLQAGPASMPEPTMPSEPAAADKPASVTRISRVAARGPRNNFKISVSACVFVSASMQAQNCDRNASPVGCPLPQPEDILLLAEF